MAVDYSGVATVRTQLFASVATETTRHDVPLAVSASNDTSFTSPVVAVSANGSGLVGYVVDSEPSDAPRVTTETFVWLDSAGQEVGRRVGRASNVVVEAASLADDGRAIVVGERLDATAGRSTLVVRSFGIDGSEASPHEPPLSGSATSGYSRLACGQVDWLVVDVYRFATGARTLEAFRLERDGTPSAPVALGELPGQDGPGTPNSRPAAEMHVACNGVRPAVAELVQISSNQQAVVLATWQ